MHRCIFTAVFLVALGSVGCATTRPAVTDVASVVADPEPLRNAHIEIQGRVEDYERPRGDRIRTWAFTVADRDGHRLPVHITDRYAEDVAAADRLVRRSLDEGGPIFAIGYLRTGRYGSRSGGPRLDLRAIQYKTDVVRLRRRGHAYDGSGARYRFYFGYGHHGHHGHYGHHY